MKAQNIPSSYINFPASVFTDTKEDKNVISIRIIQTGIQTDWQAGLSEQQLKQCAQSGFEAKDKQTVFLRGQDGTIEKIVTVFSLPLSLYAFSILADRIRAEFSNASLSNTVFKLESELSKADSTHAMIGWALSAYRFDDFKKEKVTQNNPALLALPAADKTRVQAMVEGLFLVKNLINTPPNILGTNELADAAIQVAKAGKAQFTRIADTDLIEKNFPMIYEVGKGSPRRPQLVELNWGDDSHPAVTLVGKGIVFDTGGLDIKPPAFMTLMKKDMGGAAHVLAIAHIVMALKLPVRLRVLLAVAENSVSGESFRPSDVIQTRKGLSVEIGDTDAEGRLVVADTLTYACEGRKPDMLIDFCTLTGAARVALGFDIPAMFSNRDDWAFRLKDIGFAGEDPVWPLPLYQPYLKEMKSSVADLNNIGTGKAGAIQAALFLEQFIDPSVGWIHLDCYAWEQSGKSGRLQGGADTGVRAVLGFIEEKFSAS